MWFDAQAALTLSEADRKHGFAPPIPATFATFAKIVPVPPPTIAGVAIVAACWRRKSEIKPVGADPESYFTLALPWLYHPRVRGCHQSQRLQAEARVRIFGNFFGRTQITEAVRRL